jgi:neutral trehalase
MDNSPRSGSGWVDISSQMVIQYNSMAYISDVLEFSDKSNYFEKRANDISEQINHWMWNNKDGLYYDIDDTGNQVKRQTIASFWPMLAKIPSRNQEKQLLKNLKDPKKFWRKIVFPTLSASDKDYNAYGGYWRGAVWAPTNIAVIKGLEAEGYQNVAYEASLKYLKGMNAVFKKTGTVWENYAPDYYSQGKPAKSKFVGWSGCGPITLLIENIIGIKCDAYKRTIEWNVNRLDRHGIKNLKFADFTTSLIADEREELNAPLTIRVQTNKKFTLIVNKNNDIREINIYPGENKITF